MRGAFFMVIRRHWAAVGISAGIIMAGCEGSADRASTPANLRPATEASVKKGQEMLGPGMDMLKEQAQTQKIQGPRVPGKK
jgi:hypothetical protein